MAAKEFGTNPRIYWGESQLDASNGVRRRINYDPFRNRRRPSDYIGSVSSVIPTQQQTTDYVEAQMNAYLQTTGMINTLAITGTPSVASLFWIKNYFTNRLAAERAADEYIAWRWNLPYTKRWQKIVEWNKKFAETFKKLTIGR